MDQQVTRNGKNCVETAKDISIKINKGKAEEASLKLAELKNDGAELAKQAEELANRLEIVRKYNVQKEEENQRKVGEYEIQLQQKQTEKNSADWQLDNQRSVLQQNQTSLSNAEQELRKAIDRRESKEREAKNTRVTVGIFGAVVGVLTGGIGGAIVGAAAGAGLGEAINKLKNDEERARREVDRRRSDRDSAQSEVSWSERQVQSIQAGINQLSSQIDAIKQKKFKHHEEVGKLKEVIAFLLEAVQFWSLFKQLSDGGVDQARLLKAIVDKAEATADLSVLQKNGTKIVANSFIDTWEQLETTIEDGKDRFTFQTAIEFQCTRCSTHYSEFPYIDQDRVICSNCYQQNAALVTTN